MGRGVGEESERRELCTGRGTCLDGGAAKTWLRGVWTLR